MLFSEKIEDVVNLLNSMKRIVVMMEKTRKEISPEIENEFGEIAISLLNLTGEMMEGVGLKED